MRGKAIKSIAAQHRQKSKAGRVVGMLFFLIFAIAGGVMLYFLGIRPVSSTLAARSWSEVPCRIVSAAVGSHSDSDGTTYSIDITYEYIFDGKTYRSSRYSFIGGSSSGYKRKARVVESYRTAASPVCYVNPESPSEAVLKRGFHPGLLLALFPLPFLAVGLGGIVHLLKSGPGARAREQDAQWLPQAPRPAEAGLGVMSVANISGHGTVLRPAHSPWGRVLGLTIFALLWNGIISFFVVNTIQQWRSGEGSIFTTVFMIPFVLVGLGLIAAVAYQLLAATNPRPVITLGSTSIQLGGQARLNWEFIGRVHILQNMRITLRGREEARYRRGTNTVTDKNTFFEAEVFSTQETQQMAFGQANLNVPAESMHSFEAENNKIIWEITVRGSIKSWPDAKEDFRITVTPAGVEGV